VVLSRSRTVAIAFIAALALGAFSSAVLAPEPNALGSMSTLTVVDGAVLMSRGGAAFTSAREGDVLTAGDAVRTGIGAYAEITYFEGSSVRIEVESEVVIASLRPRGTTVLGTLERIWKVVTNLVSGSTRYDVRTPSSTASMRG
jgi:hypothetical protein